MRRNRSGRPSPKKPWTAAQSDSRSHGRRLTFQSLEDRCLLTNNPVQIPITVHKDDGSIPLATDTTAVLLSGDTVVASTNIGSGPNGTTTGDFDFYKVLVHSGQMLTVEIPSTPSSSLQAVVGIFDAQGNFIQGQVDQQSLQDSYLHFTPTTGGYYYVAVGQYLSGELVSGSVGASAFPADPNNSATGPGSYTPTQGAYRVIMTLADQTAVAPVAADDTATTNQGAAVQIPVLANDTDDGVLLPSSLTIFQSPADGTAAVNATTGVVTYTPSANFSGTDTFTYTVKDADGLKSNVATVTINVNQLVTPPVAANDSYTISDNTPTALNILANDTDSSGTIVPTSVVITTQPGHGVVSIDPSSGAVTYTPTGGYLGTDSFQYKVSDSLGAVSNIATVSLTVALAPPVASNDSATTAENTPVTIDELANDVGTDAALVPGSVAIVTPPAQGTATVDPTTGAITYTPGLNYVGSDTIQYTVKDLNGTLSNVATISLGTTFVDYPPVANADSAQTNPATAVTVNVLANDTDQNNDIAPGTVGVATGPSHGTATVNSSTGAVTYTPSAGFFGTDTFTYTVATTHGAVSSPATVTVVVHQPPTANNDTVTTLEETPVTINVLANDADPAGATLLPSSVTITTQPTFGSVSVNPTTGSVLYTPAFNRSGTDTFQYTVTDSNGVTSKPGTVTVNVTFVPKAPVAANDVAGTDENAPVTVNVLANDMDYDSALAPGSITITGTPLHGSAVANANGTITYTPATGFTGADQLTYTVKDALGLTSNTATLNLRVGPPVSFAGVVYVDTNGNGIQNAGEVGLGGVTITLTKTDGPVTFSLSTTTASDGSYSFAETEGVNLLPAGTYTLTETPPIYFVDGKDTPGNVPATVTQDQFSGINLSAGQAATGFNFAEAGLKAQYVTAYFGRAFFVASTPAVSNLNLTQGSVYFALSGATQGTFTATAQSSGQGSTQVTLYNRAMQPLASTTIPAGQTQTQLNWNLDQGGAALLVVSGTDPHVNVSTTTQTPNSNTTPTPVVGWHNSANPLDVNDDGHVTPLDALAVINALNQQGSGALGSSPLGAHNYLDVTGTGTLTPIDALIIINALNTRPTAGGTAAVATADTVSTADDSTGVVSTDPVSTSAVSTGAAAPTASVSAVNPVASADSVTLANVAFSVVAAQAPITTGTASVAAVSQTIVSATASTAAPTANNAMPGNDSLTGDSGATSRSSQTQAIDLALSDWDE